jgi:sporulation protein YlmC with PRC-barrel domain
VYVVSIGGSSTSGHLSFGFLFRDNEGSWDSWGLIGVHKEVFNTSFLDLFEMSFGLGGLLHIGIASILSVEVKHFSLSDILDFSVGSIEVIGIGHNSSGTSNSISSFDLGGIGYVSKEDLNGASNGNGFRGNEPDDVFFTWGESERSSVFVVIERRRAVVLVFVVEEFHDMEIFGKEIVSFSENGVGEVENVHFFESLHDGSGSLLVEDWKNSLLFEFSLNSSMDDLQFNVEFLSLNGVFGGSMNENFTDLIFSSINISEFTKVNFRIFGEDSKNVGMVNNFNIGFLNESVIEIGIHFDFRQTAGVG